MNSDTLVIERAFSLKDPSPFIVIHDNFAQSSQYLLKEIIHRSASPLLTKIYLSFETLSKPPYLDIERDYFIDCLQLLEDDKQQQQNLNLQLIAIDKISELLKRFLASKKLDQPQLLTSSNKVLIIVDSLNYIDADKLSLFAAKLMISPNVTIISTLHLSVLESENKKFVNYPSKINLLNYIATSIFEVDYFYDANTKKNLNGAAGAIDSAEEYDEEFLHNQYYGNFLIPLNLNNKLFKVKLTKFKKSGKKLEFKCKLDHSTHEFSLKGLDDDEAHGDLESGAEGVMEGDEALLKDLSTFNLSTSSRQKQAKSKVELPFLDAQKFQDGGAIVYQFEKDDDYDEEDPYEDPF